MATPTDDTELTPKQARFVDEYLVDLNATKAAIRAGYSENGAHVQGSQLLSNPKVSDLIVAKRAELSKKTEITQERVLLELKRIAFSNMKNLAEWSDDIGVQFKDLSEIPDDVSATISEIASDATHLKGGMILVKRRVKLHDKMKALDMLAKHLDLFKESPKAVLGIVADLSETETLDIIEKARNRLLKKNANDSE